MRDGQLSPWLRGVPKAPEAPSEATGEPPVMARDPTDVSQSKTPQHENNFWDILEGVYLPFAF